MPDADAPTRVSDHLLQPVGDRSRRPHRELPHADAKSKKHSVAALKSLNFHVLAAGDAYNDTAMLGEAHAGFFFCPPDHLPKEFPQFPVTRTYGELQMHFAQAGNLK
jgi:bifunctional phosphoserine phosphatase/homoserine phosphotransferase